MARKKPKEDYGELLVCRNPKATREFEIVEKLEAGIMLMGSEVKSLRQRKADLEGAFATVDGGELYLQKMHIAPYVYATVYAHESKRPRKLLAHRREIDRWADRLKTKGYTIVPLAVYFRNGYAKVQLGLGKGRKTKDRREDIKRDVEMKEARRASRRTER